MYGCTYIISPWLKGQSQHARFHQVQSGPIARRTDFLGDVTAMNPHALKVKGEHERFGPEVDPIHPSQGHLQLCFSRQELWPVEPKPAAGVALGDEDVQLVSGEGVGEGLRAAEHCVVADVNGEVRTGREGRFVAIAQQRPCYGYLLQQI